MVRRAVNQVTILGLLFALLVSSVPVLIFHEAQAAQGATGEGNRDPRWKQYTRDRDGLVSNDTRSIWMDEDELWFGGQEGITRYTGLWKSYTSFDGADDRQALGEIQAFVRDSGNDTLWAGSSTGLVLKWNGKVWSVAANVKSEIYALVIVAGELWIGSEEGLYRFNSIEPVLVDAVGRQPVFALMLNQEDLWVGTDSGLWRYRQSRWSQMGTGERNLDLGVYALQTTPTGALVVGTAYGVGWQPGGNGGWVWYETVDERDEHAPVQTLAFDQTGVLWAGTDGAGAFALRLDVNDLQPIHYGFTGDANLTTRFVRQVAVDRDNSIWFATPAGIFRYQAYRWIHDDPRPGEDEDSHINDLLVARDGALWAVTGGMGVRRKSSLQGTDQIYRSADGATDVGYALAQDARGAIWVGGEDGLSRYLDGVWDRPVPTATLPSAVVTSLVVDSQSLWIGTTSGLALYRVTSGEMALVTSLNGLSVETLALDNLGRIWAGTLDAGIWVREFDGRWRQFQHDPQDAEGLPSNIVYSHSLAADMEVAGGMWAIVGGEELMHWNGKRWQRGAQFLPLPSNLLWTVYTDPSDGSLWIGSEVGVTHYDGMTWHTFGAGDGLQSAVIFAVARAAEGGYWFGGSSGLTYFRPDKTPPWVKLGSLGSNVVMDSDGTPILQVGEPVMLHYSAGDLQTAPNRLNVMQRVAGPKTTTPWSSTADNYFRHTFQEPGIYTLELFARDESFNYSDFATLRVQVVKPPVLVMLPFLGDVEVGVFVTLIFLGTLIVLGSGYMTTVIVANQRRGQEALARGFNPYISGEPVRRDDMFFGRRPLLQRIIDTLHNNSIMIHGERRIGKTSLLLQLMTTLREVDDPEYWFIPVYIDLEGTPQEAFFQLLIEEILVNIETLHRAAAEITPKLMELRYYTKIENSYSDRDFNRDLNRIARVLEEYGAEHEPGKHLRLILLIDEMDVMGSYDRLVQQQLRRIFMREFAATLGAVVAGIQISKEWDRVESPWFNLFNEIALTPFTREQAIELLVEPVRGYYQYELAAIEFIVDHAHGRPYKVQQYGLEAVNHMLSRQRRRIALMDVEAAHRRLEAAERAGRPSGPSKSKYRNRTMLNRLQVVMQDVVGMRPPDVDMRVAQPDEVKNLADETTGEGAEAGAQQSHQRNGKADSTQDKP
jgi:ligand-binding sensor domain-containing protein